MYGIDQGCRDVDIVCMSFVSLQGPMGPRGPPGPSGAPVSLFFEGMIWSIEKAGPQSYQGDREHFPDTLFVICTNRDHRVSKVPQGSLESQVQL